ncbi:MAG TPA: hypothetical protein VL651_07025, partial [Bacteroidia bacterium]|nr:hypothetical protein [Bacteroidia bacterium]
MISYITVRDKRKKEYKTAEGLGEIGNQVEWLDDRRIIRKETADENHILIPCLIPSKEAVIIVFGSLKDFASTAQAAVFNP